MLLDERSFTCGEAVWLCTELRVRVLPKVPKVLRRTTVSNCDAAPAFGLIIKKGWESFSFSHFG